MFRIEAFRFCTGPFGVSLRGATLGSCWDVSKDPKPETLNPNGFGIQRVSGLPEKPERHGSDYMLWQSAGGKGFP